MNERRAAPVAPIAGPTKSPKPPEAAPFEVAAVDLGSNSFHLVVAQLRGTRLRIVDRVREQVSLAAGLTSDGQVHREAQDRAVACLERFGQRLRHLAADQVRAVGTNSFRRIRDGNVFRIRVERALERPVEVISGPEEARLIYRGIAQELDDDGQRRLVVDIGGGSSECIVGRGLEVERAHSLFMGCVESSHRYFADGRITEARFDEAILAAELEIESIAEPLKSLGWSRAIGSSGTIRALAENLRELGDDAITLDGLLRLRKQLQKAGHCDRIDLPKLKTERRPVLPGGLAILIALFRMLKIEEMQPARGALREGVLYDLVGRMHQTDVRERTVERLAAHHHVDVAHAQRVEEVVLQLLQRLEQSPAAEARLAELRWPPEQLLRWAARLHEIGLSVSHTGHHKHAAYLLQHSDLPGFSEDDRRALAFLVRAQRRKIGPAMVRQMLGDPDSPLLLLALLLRVALLCVRSRAEVPPLPLPVYTEEEWALEIPEGWLEAYPLTAADLRREQRYVVEGLAIPMELR